MGLKEKLSGFGKAIVSPLRIFDFYSKGKGYDALSQKYTDSVNQIVVLEAQKKNLLNELSQSKAQEKNSSSQIIILKAEKKNLIDESVLYVREKAELKTLIQEGGDKIGGLEGEVEKYKSQAEEHDELEEKLEECNRVIKSQRSVMYQNNRERKDFEGQISGFEEELVVQQNRYDDLKERVEKKYRSKSIDLERAATDLMIRWVYRHDQIEEIRENSGSAGLMTEIYRLRLEKYIKRGEIDAGKVQKMVDHTNYKKLEKTLSNVINEKRRKIHERVKKAEKDKRKFEKDEKKSREARRDKIIKVFGKKHWAKKSVLMEIWNQNRYLGFINGCRELAREKSGLNDPEKKRLVGEIVEGAIDYKTIKIEEGRELLRNKKRLIGGIVKGVIDYKVMEVRS